MQLHATISLMVAQRWLPLIRYLLLRKPVVKMRNDCRQRFLAGEYKNMAIYFLFLGEICNLFYFLFEQESATETNIKNKR